MKEIRYCELGTVNPLEECFIIKQVFTGVRCYEAVAEVLKFWQVSGQNDDFGNLAWVLAHIW
jgi:hypothetical protein